MFQEPPREKEWHSWLFFVSWSFIIFRLAPLTRPFLLHLTKITNRDVLIYVTITVTAIAGLVGANYVIRNARLRSIRSVTTLLAVVCIYAWICWHELQAPQEALHFLEYGFLGLLAFRALSHRLRDATIYPTAVLLCGLVGNVDEILQWLTPNRYWDLRDWAWDMAAALLAQLAIAGGMRPLFIEARPHARSTRFMLRTLFAQIVVMGICLSMTPARCVWLGARFPGLDFLTWHENVMTEYGYLHRDPEIGSFYSRFTLDELKRLDDTRFDEAANIIKMYRDGLGYLVFLREINSGVDPFYARGVRAYQPAKSLLVGVVQIRRRQESTPARISFPGGDSRKSDPGKILSQDQRFCGGTIAGLSIRPVAKRHGGKATLHQFRERAFDYCVHGRANAGHSFYLAHFPDRVGHQAIAPC